MKYVQLLLFFFTSSIVAQDHPLCFPKEKEQVWELIGVEKDGQKISLQEFTDCVELYRLCFSNKNVDTFKFVVHKDTLHIQTIGTIEEFVCTIDPETYRSKVARVSCSSAVLQSIHNVKQWFFLKESNIGEYLVEVDKELLVLNLVQVWEVNEEKEWEIFEGQEKVDKLIYKRKKQE